MPTGPHILIATGGSGGHLYPAFAVTDEIERRWPEAEVRLTIGGRAIEREICETARRSARVLPLVPAIEATRHPLRFVRGFRAAKRSVHELFREVRPDCVVGTGGFTMAPVIHAAMRESIPIVLLEQNAIPGRATRWFARRAAAVCSSFDSLTPPLTASRVEYVGNPVRASIARLIAESRPESGSLLILGGSQGARALNEAFAWIAHHEPAVLAGHSIVHQTGGLESARDLEAAYRSVGLTARVAPFFDDMAALYSQASLLVARAGATTLAEAACAGIPAILLPYPFARDRHQHANAAVFERAGAALVIEQSDGVEANARRLARAVDEVLRGNEVQDRMSIGMRQLARPGAAGRVVGIIESVMTH